MTKAINFGSCSFSFESHIFIKNWKHVVHKLYVTSLYIILNTFFLLLLRSHKTKQNQMFNFVVFIFRSSRISPFRISSWRLRKRRKTLYATLETGSNQHRSFTSFIFNPFPMQEIWQVSFLFTKLVKSKNNYFSS